jgi:REase_MTES_1575/Transcriptional regulator, AbiEi antitoxin
MGRNPDRICYELARRRFGVLSRQELMAAGVTPSGIYRRSRAGTLKRLYPDTYVLAGVPETWEQRLFAACVWAGEGSAASGRAAARVLRIAGFEDAAVEISTTRDLRPRRPGPLIHLISSLQPAEIVRVGCIPVTSAERALTDLGRFVDERRLEGALDDAVRSGLTTILRVAEFLEDPARRRTQGTSVLRRLVHGRLPGMDRTQSALEAEVLRLLAKAGLPLPMTQFEIHDGRGFVARVDFAYPDKKLVIEADGYAYHSSRQDWQRDIARQNCLIRMGWGVLRFCPEDIFTRPNDVVRTVARVYRER